MRQRIAQRVQRHITHEHGLETVEWIGLGAVMLMLVATVYATATNHAGLRGAMTSTTTFYAQTFGKDVAVMGPRAAVTTPRWQNTRQGATDGSTDGSTATQPPEAQTVAAQTTAQPAVVQQAVAQPRAEQATFGLAAAAPAAAQGALLPAFPVTDPSMRVVFVPQDQSYIIMDPQRAQRIIVRPSAVAQVTITPGTTTMTLIDLNQRQMAVLDLVGGRIFVIDRATQVQLAASLQTVIALGLVDVQVEPLTPTASDTPFVAAPVLTLVRWIQGD